MAKRRNFARKFIGNKLNAGVYLFGISNGKIVCRRHVGISKAFELDTFDRPNEAEVGPKNGGGGGTGSFNREWRLPTLFVCDGINDGPNIYYYYCGCYSCSGFYCQGRCLHLLREIKN